MNSIPKKYYLAAGSSEGLTKLNAFDGALMQAGIGNTNLVKMSSICPPHCKEILPMKIAQGSLVPVAYASISSEVEGECIASAVAIGLPEDEKEAGLIMEYSAKGTKEEVEKRVREMARYGIEVTRGLKLKELKSISVEHRVKKIGATFAAVVLWW